MRLARLAVVALLAAALSTTAVRAQTPAPEEPGPGTSSPPEEQGRRGAEQQLPRCFGAASRDPVAPCYNPELRLWVYPHPAAALIEPNSFCQRSKRVGELKPCRFGVPVDQATETVVLIGDSHAAHWRAAIETVVAAKGWHGISFTKAGCPLSTAVSDLPEPGRRKCIRFKRQLFRWFERHPQIRTVITSNHVGGRVVGARNHYAAHVAGYTKALGKLPPSVTRIFSIRDVPRQNHSSMACVARAMRKRRPAGPACALPRRWALPPDPAVRAARRSDPRRVQLIDMTPFMCSPRLCKPVIGGALVHKDVSHLTRVFATTLGPYLLRYVDRAIEHLAAGTRP